MCVELIVSCEISKSNILIQNVTLFRYFTFGAIKEQSNMSHSVDLPILPEISSTTPSSDEPINSNQPIQEQSISTTSQTADQYIEMPILPNQPVQNNTVTTTGMDFDAIEGIDLVDLTDEDWNMQSKKPLFRATKYFFYKEFQYYYYNFIYQMLEHALKDDIVRLLALVSLSNASHLF